MKQLLGSSFKYFKAFRFVKQHKLWGFVIVPGLVNIAMVMAIIYASFYYSDQLKETILDQAYEWLDWLPNYMLDSIVFVMSMLIRFVLFAIYLYVYKTLIMILLSPMLSYLAEKVRLILTGEEKPFGLEQLIADSIRGIRIALRSLGMELLAYMLIFILTLMPIVQFFTPVLLILLQAYFHGFSMLDYCMEARGVGYKESILEIKKKKPLAIGNGIGFYTLTLIPIIGWMLAPTLGVIAAYLSLEGRDE
jgi:CysZ protein